MPHTHRPLTHLGDLSIETFLRDYWQKKPVLIRQAIPNFTSPLSADELAGLALEEDVVSRLITETPSQDPFKSEWDVSHGPLPDSIFESLSESHWSLLIQHADQLSPEVNQLLQKFRFLPNWRLDDIMISYAPDQGGVGPHFDYYDVFLLQAGGKRRWRLGQNCTSQSPLLPDSPMKVLTSFQTQEDWVLEPGDMLYVPPNLAHWGTAVGESITYSVGFRAPSHQDILLEATQELASQTVEDNRYHDQFVVTQNNPGEITKEAIEQLKHIISTYTQDDRKLAGWLGKTMTTPNPGLIEEDARTLEPEDIENHEFTLTPFARSSFYLGDNELDAELFVNGERHFCTAELANTLSNQLPVAWASLSDIDKRLIQQLSEQYLLVSI